MNIVHNDQSIDLNEHFIAFNFAPKFSDGLQDDPEDNSELSEDVIVEENEVDEIFLLSSCRDKNHSDPFLYSSE